MMLKYMKTVQNTQLFKLTFVIQKQCFAALNKLLWGAKNLQEGSNNSSIGPSQNRCPLNRLIFFHKFYHHLQSFFSVKTHHASTSCNTSFLSKIQFSPDIFINSFHISIYNLQCIHESISKVFVLFQHLRACCMLCKMMSSCSRLVSKLPLFLYFTYS